MSMIEETRYQREEWIDIIKGILIICVVLGHSNINYSDILFWFHMPLFFIINGYLWKNKDIKLSVFIRDKMKRLLIPWLFYFICLDLIPMVFVERLSVQRIVIRCLSFIWSGKIYQGVYWFPPVLLISSCVVFILEKYYNELTEIVACIGMYLLAIVESLLFIPDASSNIPLYLCFPWNADVCLLATSYVILGKQLKKKMVKVNSTHKTIICISSIILILIFVVLHVMNRFSYRMDMKYSLYKSFLLPVTLPLIFGCVLMYISRVINKVRIPSTIMQICGRSSLIIMFIHIPIRQFLFETISLNYNPYIYVGVCCLVGSIIYTGVNKTKARVFFLG